MKLDFIQKTPLYSGASWFNKYNTILEEAFF